MFVASITQILVAVNLDGGLSFHNEKSKILKVFDNLGNLKVRIILKSPP